MTAASPPRRRIVSQASLAPSRMAVFFDGSLETDWISTKSLSSASNWSRLFRANSVKDSIFIAASLMKGSLPARGYLARGAARRRFSGLGRRSVGAWLPPPELAFLLLLVEVFDRVLRNNQIRRVLSVQLDDVLVVPLDPATELLPVQETDHDLGSGLHLLEVVERLGVGLLRRDHLSGRRVSREPMVLTEIGQGRPDQLSGAELRAAGVDRRERTFSVRVRAPGGRHRAPLFARNNLDGICPDRLV